MLRSKRNYKTNNFIIHSKPQTICNQKQITDKDHCREEKQMIVSNIYKENWNCNTTLEHCLPRDQNITSTVLRETSSMNSVKKHIKTSSPLKRKRYKEPEESSNIPPRKTLRSARITNQLLNKCEKNASDLLLESCKNNGNSNKVKIPYVTEDNRKAVLKSNLQRSKSCNSSNNIFSNDKILKRHRRKTHCESNMVLQQVGLSEVEIKPLQNKPLKIQTNKSTKQSILKTDVRNIIDSKCRTNCNDSMKIKKENCEINNSVTIRESEKDVYRNGKKRKNVKSICRVEIKKKRQQKMYHTVHKYKQHINKTEENKFLRRTLKKENTRSFSEVTIVQSSKTDIKMNKDISEHKNCLGNKQLVIPLTRMEDIPLSKLFRLINVSNFVENKTRHESKNVYYQTRNNTEAQCSTYKHINRTTEFKQNKKINVLYHESVFEERHTNFKQNMIEEIDTNIKNIKFETNKYKMSSENKVNDTSIYQNNERKLENILQFFLSNRNITRRITRQKSRIINSEQKHIYGIRKSVAMCSKCKEVFNLLQQFSDKINFVQDEKLCIECTLCDLQINSLSHFQQHVMDVHLQCEGKSHFRKKKFAVHVINFNEQLNLNSSDKIIFECCCCSGIYNHTTDFEKHINNTHYGFNYFIDSIKKCEANQIVKTSELYTTLKNEQIFNENHTLNKNVIFDITTNITEISNQRKETDIQTSNHINKTLIENCVNTKEINFKNSVYYDNSRNENLLLKVEVQKKQINDISNSSVNQLTNTTPKMIENIENLNVDKRYSNNISKITFISGSEISNSMVNKKFKKRKIGFSFICNICFKKYKRRNFFLSHMDNHIRDSHVDVYEEQNVQKNTNDNNMIKFKDDPLISNVCTKTSENHAKSFEENRIINPTINLEEPNQKTLVPQVTRKEVDSTKDGNMECIKKDNVSIETDDCNYILHINLTQKSEEGIKRQKLIKCNINVTKKYKTNITEQKNIENEIENRFPINLITNTNFVEDTYKKNVTHGLKELHCNICDKKFSSQTILKEHMFFLHDSVFEDIELSNLPMIPYFNDYCKRENLSTTQITHVFRKKHNMSSKIKISGKLLQLYQVFSKNNVDKRSRKWRCGPCKENFALLRNYLRHKYYCHNDESVVHICDNCNKILTSVAMVNIHMCTNVTSWNCKRCNLNFSNGMSLTQHNMNNHLETVGPHVCEICKFNFLTTYMLEKHKAIHSMNNDHNSLNCFTNANTEFRKKTKLVNDDKAISRMDKKIENSTIVNELNEQFSEMDITSNVSCSDEETFKCEHCNILFTTKLQMKVHIEEWHKIEMCQICHNLYRTNELIKHLINNHMVSENLKEDSIQGTHENINFQNDIIKIVGLKRLLSLYEYQRFDNILENTCFNCIICSKQFLSIQCYKIHYLKYHDMICLLCNIEFKQNFQAFEHKKKIHKSINTYLWVVQKLTLAILQLSERESTIEKAILKYSEIRMY